MAKDKLPTRPKYISRITTIRLIMFNCVVSPAVMPTVLIAEITSKRVSKPLKFCRMHKINAAVVAKKRLVQNTAADLRSASSSKRLPKIL